MWTALQIGVCVVFLLLTTFFVGKKLGQRGFIKIRDEMKALELSFKHLADDINMVSDYNLKALESQSSELKELLTVTDKKCLYAGDLLKEIDHGVESLRKRNLNPANALNTIDQGLDKRFRKEVQDSLEEINGKLNDLTARIKELEADKLITEPDEIRNMINREVARQLKNINTHTQTQENLARQTENPIERLGIFKPAMRDNFAPAAAVSAAPPVSKQTNTNIKELKTTSIDDLVRLPITPAIKKTDLDLTKVPHLPPAGFPVREVLKMFEEGVTLPQIARALNMSKGEIELILKIYGEGVNMRNVI
ncbi:MAG: hypothetical protein EOM80_13655 [Erysipelotrichia bacterium]|nr:hypothetical protein [Erysipelotrichia bacterium]